MSIESFGLNQWPFLLWPDGRLSPAGCRKGLGVKSFFAWANERIFGGMIVEKWCFSTHVAKMSHEARRFAITQDIVLIQVQVKDKVGLRMGFSQYSGTVSWSVSLTWRGYKHRLILARQPLSIR